MGHGADERTETLANNSIEAVFEAGYAWENGAGPERAERWRDCHRLLGEALAKAASSAASRESSIPTRRRLSRVHSAFLSLVGEFRATYS